MENPYSPNKESANWFHFNEEGIMTFGWYKDIQDGNVYFLDQKTGIMSSGWQKINGKQYYFATLEEVPRQT